MCEIKEEEKIVYKIGQAIKSTDELIINSAIGNDVIVIEKGSVGIVDCRGFLHWTTGAAAGKIQKIGFATVEGYDIESISSHIYHRLNSNINIKQMLDDYDIDTETFITEILFALDDIF